jgi:hypothetical protein
MSKRLLPRAQQVYEFIIEFKSTHDGNSPSVREISDACGISSVSVTCYYLGKLTDAGMIAIEKGKGRGTGKRNLIEVIGGTWTAPKLILTKDDAHKLITAALRETA